MYIKYYLAAQSVMNVFIPLILFGYFSITPSTVDPLKGKDLFGNPSEIREGWLGYLQSKNNVQKFSNVPMFIIDKADGTYAKIIGVPKSPKVWASKFIGKTTAQKVIISKTLIQGIHSHSMGGSIFKVFAFVQYFDKMGLKSSQGRSAQMKFPSKITVYQNEGTKWNRILERIIINNIDYQKLQYEIAANY